MNVLQTGESIENGLELLTEGLLSILDLTGVETCTAKFSISDHALSITPISFFFSLQEGYHPLDTATGE
jgi:hypothetical protein